MKQGAHCSEEQGRPQKTEQRESDVAAELEDRETEVFDRRDANGAE